MISDVSRCGQQKWSKQNKMRELEQRIRRNLKSTRNVAARLRWPFPTFLYPAAVHAAFGCEHRVAATLPCSLRTACSDDCTSSTDVSQSTATPPEDGVERWIASWGRCKKKTG